MFPRGRFKARRVKVRIDLNSALAALAIGYWVFIFQVRVKAGGVGGLFGGGSAQAAGGGFLLYPNKSNLNMMRSVYQK